MTAKTSRNAEAAEAPELHDRRVGYPEDAGERVVHLDEGHMTEVLVGGILLPGREIDPHEAVEDECLG